MRLDDDINDGSWLLTPAEQALVMAKNNANRLGFALLLLYFRGRGRFPPNLVGIDAQVRAQVAQQLGLESELRDGYDPSHRTWKRCRAEIRAWFGFREATVADAEGLEAWLCDQAVSIGGNRDRLAALVTERCRELAIEPPTAERVDRIVRAALYAHDERVYADILARLPLLA